MRETNLNSVERSLALLKATIADGGQSTVSDLARKLDIPIASAHRHIAALVAGGFLVSHRYGRHLPGAELRALAPLLDQRQIMAHAAKPVLERLASKSASIIQLGVFEADMVTYLVKAGQSADALFTKVGMQLEAYCSGIGKVLLASLPKAEQARYLAGGPFVALTEKTITNSADLRNELDRVAAQGFACDDEEVVIGLQCLAVPVKSGAGHVVAAISTSRKSGPDLGNWQKAALPHLKIAAQEIGDYLG